MDEQTFAIIANTAANVASCAAITVGAYYLSQWGNLTARYLSQMLYCISAEIVLATVALYFLDNFWMWIGLRLAGRVVEFVGVVRFLRYLTLVGKGPEVGDAHP